MESPLGPISLETPASPEIALGWRGKPYNTWSKLRLRIQIGLRVQGTGETHIYGPTCVLKLPEQGHQVLCLLDGGDYQVDRRPRLVSHLEPRKLNRLIQSVKAFLPLPSNNWSWTHFVCFDMGSPLKFQCLYSLQHSLAIRLEDREVQDSGGARDGVAWVRHALPHERPPQLLLCRRGHRVA